MQKYKIVHLIHNDKFIIPFMDFVAKRFDENEHLYVYLFDDNVVKYPIPKSKNILNLCNRYLGKKNIFGLSKVLNPIMEKAEKVILHGLFSEDLINYLYLHQYYLKKCYWVMWGGDLYGHIDPIKTWKNIFMLHRRRRVVQKMGGLITYIKGDYGLARRHFGTRGKHYECFMYPSNLYKEYDIKPKEHSTISILLGNSADPTNNHIEVLNRLRKYKGENIKIFAPLSYGNQDHAKKVIKKGKDLFGDKFVALAQFMPFDKYLELLSEIDIAIFAHRRQQAMGNIITLLGLGKKVYMRSDITPWKLFKDIDVKIFAVENIELELITEKDRLNNQKKIKEYFSKENYLIQLQNLFES
jgi:dTDP-N-acetylfucosamine:lipid II N-acetylfucosaminyltransferase